MTMPNASEGDGAWERILDLVADEVFEMSPEQIRAELASRNISVSASVVSIRRAIAARQAEELLGSVGGLWETISSAFRLNWRQVRFELSVTMGGDSRATQASIPLPEAVRESCPWAESIEVRKSESKLVLRAIAPPGGGPGSTAAVTTGSEVGLRLWLEGNEGGAVELRSNMRIDSVDLIDSIDSVGPRLLLSVTPTEARQ